MSADQSQTTGPSIDPTAEKRWVAQCGDCGVAVALRAARIPSALPCPECKGFSGALLQFAQSEEFPPMHTARDDHDPAKAFADLMMRTLGRGPLSAEEHERERRRRVTVRRVVCPGCRRTFSILYGRSMICSCGTRSDIDT